MFSKHVAIVFIAFSAVQILNAAGPWSISPLHPVIQEQAVNVRDQHQTRNKLLRSPDSTKLACGLWLAFYQRGMRPVSRSRCTMLPSCSNYAIDAISKHGVLIGIIMAADRMLHESDELLLQRVVVVAGESYRPDPVENNDFWWYR